MPALRLLRGWSDSNDSGGRKGKSRLVESVEAVGVNAVVVGEEDGHEMEGGASKSWVRRAGERADLQSEH